MWGSVTKLGILQDIAGTLNINPPAQFHDLNFDQHCGVHVN